MICIVLAVSLLSVSAAEGQNRVSVTFYHTTDIHEHSAPLPRIAGFVEARRKEDPNVLLVDTGDWFDGGDLTELKTRGEAIVAMLSACKYDAMIFGNLEYSFGTPRLAELIDRFSLPIVAANCVWSEDIKPNCAVTYRIFKLNGVTVAIIGTATPYTTLQVDSLLKILPLDESLRDVVSEVKQRADIIVLLTHVGPQTDEKLAQELPDVDIIFGGHAHLMYGKLFIAPGTDTVIQHSGCDGLGLGELTITWDGEKIVDRKLRLVFVTDELPESAAVAEIRMKYLSQAATDAAVSSP
jgi:2',3'-cyclic-nucleotide 2'-phosphodiesterase (5'-nucleotidase family)